MKETVLKSAHEALGARLVPFGGWAMPVQYRPILDEAKTVRHEVGMFDLGHMGRVAVTGSDAEAFLQAVQTNDAAKIQPGRIRYALILDEDGRTQDDILVYREPDDSGFFVVVNASNTERDLEIMQRTASQFGDVNVTDLTPELGMVALQGPNSVEVMKQITDVDVDGMKYYGWDRGEVCGVRAAISRTGYTGEDGFEVYLPQAATPDLWNTLLEVGASQGLTACGLGSRDILRLEAGMALYGHEIDETTTPLDAGLDWAVKFTHDFTGREALERIRANGGPERELVGLKTDSKRVPRQGYTLWQGDDELGIVCSGGMSPTLSTNIATAYVKRGSVAIGDEIEFAIRDKREPATVAALPFYKRAK
ncbi:MAG: glycine cleavage system aminomethyltransferase GcvT [Planctomycetes bacterium]|nr:glycine cleavage system aminomethyltransferase GcvT [Planctomycetota bacterium]